MSYPVWDIGFAHGLLIGLVAILHVYISHFAVGGGLYLVLTETIARRRRDSALLEYLHGHARFFILLTLVLGAITGVAIWFTIGLINPAGTSTLIHAYVWGWAIEWVFFFTEIAAAMVYYYGWRRLSSGRHLAVGWIYFGAAWASMVIINGILTFQLTPGAWLETRGFWDGFFNPTYWPSLLSRTAFAIALAGFFALITAVRMRDARLRGWLVWYSGIWSAAGLAACALLSVWWWQSVPESIRLMVDGNMRFASFVADALPMVLGALALLILGGPLAMPKSLRAPGVAAILIAGILVMGSGEWIREAIRKPWVVHEYMYSNGIRADQVASMREDGLLAHAKWIDPGLEGDPVSQGEAMFVAACGSCHARTGYNGLAGRLAGWSESHIAAMVTRLEHMRRPMPPWIGNDAEATLLAGYLKTIALDPKPSERDGRQLFEFHCASCHSVDGFRAIRELVEGFDAADLDEFMSEMESDEMPPFSGSDAERSLLAEWLANQGAMESSDIAANLERGVSR